MILRPYQRRALDDLYEWFGRHPEGNPIVDACVGAGKSVLIATLCREAIEQWPETRIVMTVASRELCQQNLHKLLAVWPDAPASLYSASLGARQLGGAVLYSTIGSVYKKAHLLGAVSLLLVDECFPADTMVETINGPKRIADIATGDAVYTATGIGVVEAISARKSRSLTKVRLSDGSSFRATDNHPVFTSGGWKPAGKLARGDGLARLQDMPALWGGLLAMAEDQGRRYQDGAIQAVVREGKVLLDLLCQEEGERDVGARSQGQDVGDAQEDRAQAVAGWWKRPWNDRSTRDDAFDVAAWMGAGSRNSYGDQACDENPSDLLQGGHRESFHESGDRVGREHALRGTKGSRQEEGRPTGFARVESVSREECGCDVDVYNLQVSGHPSYFADGVLAHNCHLIGSAESGMYRQLIADLTKYNPGLRVIGWTGTAFRGNGIWLTDQDEPIFHGIAAKITMRELLDSKYLAPLRSIATQTQINTAGLGLQAGDYRVSELADVSDREALVRAACSELVTLAAGRNRWLVYGVTIAHATHIRDALRDLGVVAEMVSATTPLAERDAIIKAFRAGRVRALVNVAVLTTGFDVPEVDCIALLRATRSPVMYSQIAGRGLRIADGKQDCAWIDFTSTTATLGPVDQIKGRAKPRQRMSQGAPFRICPQCGSHNATAALACIDCGQAFPAPERINHMAHASAADVLSSEQATKVTRYPVTAVRYARHTKPGAPDSIRADYYSGLRKVAAEWVTLDHPGYAGEKARQWWARRAPREFLPGSVDQALEWIRTGYVLRTPLEITVNESGRWPEIIGSTWDEQSTSGSEAGNAAARTAAPEVGGIHLHPMRELRPTDEDLQRV